MDANLLEKANLIVQSAPDAYMGVLDESGYPSVSTLSSIQADGIFKAWFATGLQGNKAMRILRDTRVSVCYRRDGDNVTLVGTAKILTDQQTKDALWQDWFIHHFPGGKEDPQYCIIEFVTQRVSLWIDSESAEFPVGEVLQVQSRCGLLCNCCSFRGQCNCGGCMQTNGHPFHGECPVAACCQNKGFTHCGQCVEMPCEQLHEYACLDPEHGDQPAGARLSVLRRW